MPQFVDSGDASHSATADLEERCLYRRCVTISTPELDKCSSRRMEVGESVGGGCSRRDHRLVAVGMSEATLRSENAGSVR